MTKEELKRKYGIHKIENESPSTEGSLMEEGVECGSYFSVWSDGKIKISTGTPAKNNLFSVSDATWTIVQQRYKCKWQQGWIKVVLYTKMTNPDLIDAFLERTPRRGVNEFGTPVCGGWIGDYKK